VLSTKDKKGLWVIAGVIGALAAVFAAQVTFGNKPKAGPDNCVGEVVTNTVVVLDYTEQITDQTRDEITARVMAHIHDKVR
jgi:hypothetical protein